MSAPNRVEAIFHQAIAIAGPAERAGFIRGACDGDSALQQQVENLLRAHEAAGGFLSLSTSDKVPTVDSTKPLTEGPGTVIDRYKLLEKLGEGGFGAVYVAEQREPVRRRVALKIIKLGMDTTQVVARFEAERQALALMDHPNIAKVLDAGATETGRPYFVMELVRGVPITKYCDENKLNTSERLTLFIQICHAIQHAHQKGIIHRDIKPSNILITLHDGVPIPKVIDFGIAKATQGDLTDKTIYTQFQQFIGTPAYMSPEQAEMSGLDIDTRSDIYSLGVLLYELLTGSTPFDTKELMQSGLDEMRRIIREREPVRPSTRLTQLQTDPKSRVKNFKSKIENDLDWIVMKCLEKDRTRRYETANGLAMDIKRHLNQEPVIARPPSASYRFQKLIRRNKLVFAAAGIVLIVIFLALLATSLGWRAARVERDRAVKARADEAAQRQQTERARAKEEEQRREAERQRRIARMNTYAADMKATQVALAQNNRGQAADLLNRYRPVAGEEDLRGIEWRYLWQASRGQEIHSWPHPTFAMGARFSPDGRTVVTDCFDGVLRIWDVGTRKLVRQVERDARDDFFNVSICFAPDGRTLAATESKGILVIDPRSGKVIRRLHELSDKPNALRPDASLAWSPNGKWLAARVNQHIKIWNTENWEGSSFPVEAWRGIAFTSETVLAVIVQNAVELWDVLSKKRVGPLATEFGGRVQSLAASVDGTLLAVGNFNGEVGLWDVKTGKTVWIQQVHRSELTALAFSTDGARLATGGFDQTIRLWDIQKGVNIETFHGHLNEIWALEFSPDNRFIVSASKDGTVKLWEVGAARRSAPFWIEGTDLDLGFAADGRRLITVTADGKFLRHWERGEVVTTVKLHPPLKPGFPPRIVFSPSGLNLFVWETNGIVF